MGKLKNFNLGCCHKEWVAKIWNPFYYSITANQPKRVAAHGAEDC